MTAIVFIMVLIPTRGRGLGVEFNRGWRRKSLDIREGSLDRTHTGRVGALL